jgi:hypothetical protein
VIREGKEREQNKDKETVEHGQEGQEQEGQEQEGQEG